MKNLNSRKGPSQGQTAPRDPRKRRPRTAVAGPGRQDLVGEASHAPAPPRDVSTDVAAACASHAPPHSPARAPRPAPSAYVERAVRPPRAASPHVSRALVAATSRPASATSRPASASSAYSDRPTERPAARDRAAAPARAPPAARAPRALAAEQAAGTAAATHRVHAAAPARAEPAVRALSAPIAATGAATSAAHGSHAACRRDQGEALQRTQQPRSMPSLEAQDEQQLYSGKELSPRIKLALLEAIGCTSSDEMHELLQQKEDPTPISEEEERHLAMISTSLPTDRVQRSRRPRHTSDSDSDADNKRQRVGLSESSATELMDDMPCDEDLQPRRTPTTHTQTSYAEQARKTPSPQPTGSTPVSRTQPPTTRPNGKQRYPPLIVENLPNWATHFKVMKKHLGRAPNARPFGKGVKFIPQEDQEYRYIQRYLTSLEKTERISWFSYSLPADRNLKVAIRGIPADTDPEDIMEDLRGQGLEPEYVRPIRARRGRPGCIFLGIFRRTATTIPEIYKINEILCMPGITIEAWRGKKGPPQCHRCQGWRHSSQHCHRKQACVRCGQEHSAHECPRPLAEPATCANCSGPHPANYVSCPMFRREARNKKAGTIATTTKTKINIQQEKPTTAAPQGSNIRTPANEPRTRGTAARRRRPRGKRGRETEQPPRDQRPHHNPEEAPTAKRSGGKQCDKDAVLVAIETLHEVLQAVRDGKDPTKAVLRGLVKLGLPGT